MKTLSSKYLHKKNNKAISLLSISAALLCCSFYGTAHADTEVNCRLIKNLAGTERDGSLAGSLGQYAGAVAGIIGANSGCYDEATLAASQLEKFHFRIGDPAGVGGGNSNFTMHINPYDNGNDVNLLEGWRRTHPTTKGWTDTFKLWKPITVLDADTDTPITLWHIAAVGGSRGSDCFGIDQLNQVQGNICEPRHFRVDFGSGSFESTTYPVLWKVENSGGKVQFIAYKTESVEGKDLSMESRPYKKIGLMGYNETKKSISGYFGWADVLPSNTRAWTIYPAS